MGQHTSTTRRTTSTSSSAKLATTNTSKTTSVSSRSIIKTTGTTVESSTTGTTSSSSPVTASAPSNATVTPTASTGTTNDTMTSTAPVMSTTSTISDPTSTSITTGSTIALPNSSTDSTISSPSPSNSTVFSTDSYYPSASTTLQVSATSTPVKDQAHATKTIAEILGPVLGAAVLVLAVVVIALWRKITRSRRQMDRGRLTTGGEENDVHPHSLFATPTSEAHLLRAFANIEPPRLGSAWKTDDVPVQNMSRGTISDESQYKTDDSRPPSPVDDNDVGGLFIPRSHAADEPSQQPSNETQMERENHVLRERLRIKTDKLDRLMGRATGAGTEVSMETELVGWAQ